MGDNFTAVFNREDNYDARISLATPFLEVPRSHARLILHEFAGFMTHGEGPLNLDPINCSQIDSMPAIAISIGSGFESISYTVPAKEFVVRQVSLGLSIYRERTGFFGNHHGCRVSIHRFNAKPFTTEKHPQISEFFAMPPSVSRRASKIS